MVVGRRHVAHLVRTSAATDVRPSASRTRPSGRALASRDRRPYWRRDPVRIDDRHARDRDESRRRARRQRAAAARPADDASRTNARTCGVACDRLAPIAEQHELVISHGNGPQIGLLALEEAAYEEAPDAPLDVLGAETQGMIGYLDRAGAREPAAVREAARDAAHDDRGRSRRSGVRRPDEADRPALHAATRPTSSRPSAAGCSSPTATACGASCRRRRRKRIFEHRPIRWMLEHGLRRDLRGRRRHPDRVRRRAASSSASRP